MSDFSNAVRVFIGLKLSETSKIFRDLRIEPLKAEDKISNAQYLMRELKIIREENRRYLFVAAVNKHLEG